MLKLFGPTRRSTSLQALRADTLPAGGDSLRRLSRQYLVLAGRGGHDRPGSAWFWCVRDRDDGVMSMFDELRIGGVASPKVPCDRLTHPTGFYRGPDR